MPSLPPAPASVDYQEVRVAFERMTDGDEARGFVPGYHFRIHDQESNDVGHLNIRVGDTEHVRRAAGHLGFEISEQYRGHGYAWKACLALKPWLSTVRDRLLVTVDPRNGPSLRTLEKIGARFLDVVEVPVGDPHFLRGSRVMRRFEWRMDRE